jgi:protein-disulfide isomerase
MTVRSPRRTTLALSFLVSTACTPACTPPDADPPITSLTSDGGGGGADAGGGLPPGEMIMEAKGVDTSKLTEAQRATFFQMINVEPSACGQAHSLAKSLRDDAECRDSLVISQFIAERIGAGAVPADVKLELDEVVDALRVREIDVTGRPVFGNERAPVTIVVFADFECPHCRAESPVLRKAVQQYRGQVKLVYRHFPLHAHPRAKVAAVACEAAHVQGKFWECHDAVFENQTKLTDEAIEGYVRGIKGLDHARWKTDFESGKFEAVVEQDRVDGEALEITGTPAVFVNGRYYHPALFGGTIEGWIEDALRR